MQVCQAIEGLTAAALAVGTLGGWISKDFILITLFFFGAARAFESTTNQTLLPAMVPAALFPRAVAASSSAQQAATIAGPAVGGLLYALSPGIVYFVAGAMFVAAAVALIFVTLIQADRGMSVRPPVTFEVFFAGVGFIRRNPIVLGVISLDLFAVFLGGATALLPIFAKDVFNVGPEGLGLLRAAPAVGALGVMVALSRATFTQRVGQIMFTAVACFGVATVVFAVSTSFWLSMAALVLYGASDAVSVVIRQTLVQLETPDEMRGRVSAVNALFVGMSNQLGDFRAGMAAGLIGAVPAVLVGGIGTLLTVLFSIRIFPELYAIEGFHTVRKSK
jgi:MFS family permease